MTAPSPIDLAEIEARAKRQVGLKLHGEWLRGSTGAEKITWPNPMPLGGFAVIATAEAIDDEWVGGKPWLCWAENDGEAIRITHTAWLRQPDDPKAQMIQPEEVLALLARLRASEEEKNEDGDNASWTILAVVGNRIDERWRDEFREWYKPSEWLGLHRAVASFVAMKFEARLSQAVQEAVERERERILASDTFHEAIKAAFLEGGNCALEDFNLGTTPEKVETATQDYIRVALPNIAAAIRSKGE